MNRRKAIAYGGLGTTFMLTGCCPLIKKLNEYCESRPNGEEPPETSPGGGSEIAWDERVDWWRERKKERDEQRIIDIGNGDRRNVRIPSPYLNCGEVMPSSKGWLTDQLHEAQYNDEYEIATVISNLGNGPSYCCVVDIYESSHFSYNLPFKSFTHNDQKVVSVLAGEHKEVVLKYKIARHDGSLWIRCYDPFFDPAPANAYQYDRLNTGVGYSRLD